MKPNKTENKPKMGACFNHYDPFAPECVQCLAKRNCLNSTMEIELKELLEDTTEDGLQELP